VMENEKLRVMVLAEKGADIYEILYKPLDIDCMWRSPLELDGTDRNPATKQFESGSFLGWYEGGWQELLPSITAPTDYKGMSLGFHGESLFLPWKYSVVEDSPDCVSIKFFVRMRRAPLFATRVMTLRSEASVIEFDECVRNEGDEPFDFMWGHHPALGKPFLDENCVIDIPKGAVGQTYQADFSGNSPFAPNVEFEWPYAPDKNNNRIDLSRVMPPEKKTAFNIYIKNVREGWYGVTNLKKKIGFGLKWDVQLFKYMLLWSVYRGFYNSPFYGRTYNIALELYSAIPDSLDEVIPLGRSMVLQPLHEMKTKFSCILYESDRRIRGYNDDNSIIPA